MPEQDRPEQDGRAHPHRPAHRRAGAVALEPGVVDPVEHEQEEDDPPDVGQEREEDPADDRAQGDRADLGVALEDGVALIGVGGQVVRVPVAQLLVEVHHDGVAAAGEELLVHVPPEDAGQVAAGLDVGGDVAAVDDVPALAVRLGHEEHVAAAQLDVLGGLLGVVLDVLPVQIGQRLDRAQAAVGRVEGQVPPRDLVAGVRGEEPRPVVDPVQVVVEAALARGAVVALDVALGMVELRHGPLVAEHAAQRHDQHRQRDGHGRLFQKVHPVPPGRPCFVVSRVRIRRAAPGASSSARPRWRSAPARPACASARPRSGCA